MNKSKKIYTIISGTNRVGSNTLYVAQEYQRILQQKNIEAGLFSLENINLVNRDADFDTIENDIIIPTTNYIFISPEYNGSYPGALKMFFDNSSSHAIWWNKKALLTGLSAGRAGNLRGMDHLAGVLNYLKITVHPNQLPISLIDKLLDEGGRFNDGNTINAISRQLDEFIDWSR